MNTQSEANRATEENYRLNRKVFSSLGYIDS